MLETGADRAEVLGSDTERGRAARARARSLPLFRGDAFAAFKDDVLSRNATRVIANH